MRTLIASILLLVVTGCGALITKQSELPNPPPSSATNDLYVPNPIYTQPLEAVRDTQVPYAAPIAGALLAILGAYAQVRNSKLKRTAKVLIQSIDDYKAATPQPELVEKMKALQKEEGVRATVNKLRDS